MAKNNNKNPRRQQQVKLDNPQDVELGKQVLRRVSETDKGEILRDSGVHYLQNWWKPVIPTPELRPIINLLARCVARINTVMQLMTRRKIPVEALSIISETKIREEVVKPISEILQNYTNEIEAVLNKYSPRKERDAGRKKKAGDNRGAESMPDIEPAAVSSGRPETNAEYEPAIESQY